MLNALVVRKLHLEIYFQQLTVRQIVREAKIKASNSFPCLSRDTYSSSFESFQEEHVKGWLNISTWALLGRVCQTDPSALHSRRLQSSADAPRDDGERHSET